MRSNISKLLQETVNLLHFVSKFKDVVVHVLRNRPNTYFLLFFYVRKYFNKYVTFFITENVFTFGLNFHNRTFQEQEDNNRRRTHCSVGCFTCDIPVFHKHPTCFWKHFIDTTGSVWMLFERNCCKLFKMISLVPFRNITSMLTLRQKKFCFILYQEEHI